MISNFQGSVMGRLLLVGFHHFPFNLSLLVEEGRPMELHGTPREIPAEQIVDQASPIEAGTMGCHQSNYVAQSVWKLGRSGLDQPLESALEATALVSDPRHDLGQWLASINGIQSEQGCGEPVGIELIRGYPRGQGPAERDREIGLVQRFPCLPTQSCSLSPIKPLERFDKAP